MAIILAIDPGVSYIAWALGDDQLRDARLYEFANYYQLHSYLSLLADDCGVEKIIVEEPVIYSRGTANHTDIKKLYGTACVCSGARWNSVFIQPRQWKGSTPKKIHQPRILAALTPGEMRHASKNHNIIDAIGIYLWARENL